MISIDQGRLGESHVAAYFTTLNYDVFLPIFSYPECDMIVMKDGIIKRVEVKATSVKNEFGSWTVSVRRIRNNGKTSKSHNWNPSCADLLAVYIVPLNKVMVFEAKDIKTGSTFAIRLDDALIRPYVNKTPAQFKHQ